MSCKTKMIPQTCDPNWSSSNVESLHRFVMVCHSWDTLLLHQEDPTRFSIWYRYYNSANTRDLEIATSLITQIMSSFSALVVTCPIFSPQNHPHFFHVVASKKEAPTAFLQCLLGSFYPSAQVVEGGWVFLGAHLVGSHRNFSAEKRYLAFPSQAETETLDLSEFDVIFPFDTTVDGRNPAPIDR